MYQNDNCNPAKSSTQKIGSIFPTCDNEHSCCIKSHNEAFDELKVLLIQLKLNEDDISFIGEVYGNFIEYVLKSISNNKQTNLLHSSSSRNADILLHRHISLIAMLINHELQEEKSLTYDFEWTVQTKVSIFQWLHSNEKYECQDVGSRMCIKLKVILRTG
jgi:hypothetical protein